MSNNFSQTYAPQIVGSVVGEVAGGLVGKSLVDSLRRSFTSSSQVQLGDYFMDQSRALLQNHLQLIDLHDQGTILRNYEILRDFKQGLDGYDGSKFQKFLKARKYRRISKETYKIVKKASNRGIDKHLINQIEEATRPPPPPPGSGSGMGAETSTVGSNPFGDSHRISTITDPSVDDLDRVEMSTYHEETTNGAAVVLDVVGQDGTVRHIVGTFSTEAFTGGWGASQSTAQEVPAALSLHRDDGSSPHFIAAPMPDISDERADERGEARTPDSFALSELRTSEGNRPHVVTRPAVQPADDPLSSPSYPRRR